MKAILILIILVVLAQVMAAESPSVTIYTPKDNITSEKVQNSFVFEVRGSYDAEKCSLIIDGELLKTYAAVPKLSDREFTATLTNGLHEWQVVCDVNGEIVESELRVITVGAPEDSSGCVKKIYRGSGSFRYLMDTDCLQNEITLSGVRVGDWIEIRVGQKTYGAGFFESQDNLYIMYVVKLGSNNGEEFYQFSSNKDRERKNVFMGNEYPIDITGNGMDDISLRYDSIERRKATLTFELLNAELVSEPKPIEPEEPAESVEEEVEEVIIDHEPNAPVEDETDAVIPETDSKGKFYGTILLIIILAIILIVILRSGKKKTKTKVKKADFMLESHKKRQESTGKKTKDKKAKKKDKQPEPKEPKKPSFMIDVKD